MQGYVSGYNGNGMWGFTDQLVLIDGVPREASNVKPDEIEEITFLKGPRPWCSMAAVLPVVPSSSPPSVVM